MLPRRNGHAARRPSLLSPSPTLSSPSRPRPLFLNVVGHRPLPTPDLHPSHLNHPTQCHRGVIVVLLPSPAPLSPLPVLTPKQGRRRKGGDEESDMWARVSSLVSPPSALCLGWPTRPSFVCPACPRKIEFDSGPSTSPSPGFLLPTKISPVWVLLSLHPSVPSPVTQKE
uniref:Uncharacterized protein n=1 Tax=Leersia perrieri TaxID=77586 RepID=A0A0D9VW67_9ORYZ